MLRTVRLREMSMSDRQHPQDGMRDLSRSEIYAVGGAGILANIGCIRISPTLPMPPYNPWLDPYSPERRIG